MKGVVAVYRYARSDRRNRPSRGIR